MDPDGEFTLLEAGMGTTNGIELSPDERRLYVNESVQRRVWVYRVSATGELSDKRLFYQFDDYGLDGMATDPEGNLYIARYGAGTVAVLSPHGELIEEISLKGRYPTNIALDLRQQPRAFVTLQQRGAIEMFELAPRLHQKHRPAANQTPVAELLSREQFNSLFPERNPFYDYDGLLAASRQFPAFAGVGDRETRLRELAAALANFAHETGDLVYIPGHVMMVLGHVDGDPVAIHDTSGMSWLPDGASELQRLHLNGVVVTPILPMMAGRDTPTVDRITAIQRIRP